jgi:hypothetical protein
VWGADLDLAVTKFSLLPLLRAVVVPYSIGVVGDMFVSDRSYEVSINSGQYRDNTLSVNS